MLPQPTSQLVSERRSAGKGFPAQRQPSVLGARPALPVDRTDIARAGAALAAQVGAGEVEVSVLLLRLDGLAEVRRRHGDAAATYLCTELIRRLLRCTRPRDVAGRCGGEDALVLLLPCAPAEADALGHQVAARARAELSRPVQYRTLSLRVACSAGRARWHRQAGPLDAAIEQARQALRAADQPRVPAVPARFALGSEAAESRPGAAPAA